MTTTRARGLVALLLALALAGGFAIGRGLPLGGASAGTGADGAESREVLYWVAPMDKNFRRDKPGKSPMGMDLVPVYADDAATAAEAGVVTIDPAMVQNFGLRSAPAERGVLTRRIEAVGYVEYDEDTMHHVHTRVDGWIESLGVQAAGDPVVKGQVLFEIYSPTLVNAQREYLTAQARNSEALRRASRDRLLALGMGEEEIRALTSAGEPHQRVRVLAATDGVVTHLSVRDGIHVTPATHMLTVANLNRVWVLAEVFDRHAAWVAPGQRAEVTLENLPGATREGTVDYVYPELDPRTRSLKVRIGFANAGHVLRPNMFARVTLFAGDVGPVVHIPREALIRGGDFDRVALDMGAGHYRAVPVTAQLETGGRVAVSGGLRAGQLVVTSGQFLIDSESNLASALARFDGARATPSEGAADAPAAAEHHHHRHSE